MNPKQIAAAEEALYNITSDGIGTPTRFADRVALIRAAEFGVMVAKARLEPIGATGPPVYLHPDDPRAMLGSHGH